MPRDTYPADGAPQVVKIMSELVGFDERRQAAVRRLDHALKCHEEAVAALLGAEREMSEILNEMRNSSAGIVANAVMALEDAQ